MHSACSDPVIHSQDTINLFQIPERMQSEDKIQEFWPPALLHTTTSSSEDSSLFNCENEAVHDADGFSSSLAWAAPSEADGFGLASPELPELVQVVTTLEPTSPCNRSNLQLSPTLQVDAVELEFRNITCSLDVFQSDLASPPLQPVIQGCQSIRKQVSSTSQVLVENNLMKSLETSRAEQTVAASISPTKG